MTIQRLEVAKDLGSPNRQSTERFLRTIAMLVNATLAKYYLEVTPAGPDNCMRTVAARIRGRPRVDDRIVVYGDGGSDAQHVILVDHNGNVKADAYRKAGGRITREGYLTSQALYKRNYVLSVGAFFDRYFNKTETAALHPFPFKKYLKVSTIGQLPKHYQQAIQVRLKETWHSDASGKEHLKDTPVQWGEVPTQMVADYVMLWVGKQYKTFEAWMQHREGRGHIPDHPTTKRWPILLWSRKKFQPFEDGFHRFTAYVKRGDKTVPVVELDYAHLTSIGWKHGTEMETQLGEVMLKKLVLAEGDSVTEKNQKKESDLRRSDKIDEQIEQVKKRKSDAEGVDGKHAQDTRIYNLEKQKENIKKAREAKSSKVTAKGNDADYWDKLKKIHSEMQSIYKKMKTLPDEEAWLPLLRRYNELSAEVMRMQQLSKVQAAVQDSETNYHAQIKAINDQMMGLRSRIGQVPDADAKRALQREFDTLNKKRMHIQDNLDLSYINIKRVVARVKDTSAIKGAEYYHWYNWTGKDGYEPVSESKRIPYLLKGMKFGLRPSSNGKHIRMVTDDGGLTRVSTIAPEEYKYLIKNSKMTKAP